jgi:hypothetical protein
MKYDFPVQKFAVAIVADSDLFLFVSHVSEDREAAMEIVDELERRGVRCWVAPRNVAPASPSMTRPSMRSRAAGQCCWYSPTSATRANTSAAR